MNLTDMRTRVRQDLQDTDSANYRWTDDEVDGAIQRAVREFSFLLPVILITPCHSDPDSEGNRDAPNKG